MTQRNRDLAVKTSELYHVDPKTIEVDESWNLRNDYGDTDELASSISELGVQVPLTVQRTNGHFAVVDGHRRMRAIKSLLNQDSEAIKTVPVMVVDKTVNDADRVLMQITRNSGKPFSTLEQAKVIKRLVSLGMEPAEIAQKLGRSQSHINNALTLLQAPQSVLVAVQTGEIAASTVTQIVRDNDGDEEAVSQQVNSALSDAQEQGKKKATKKNVKNDQQDKPESKAESKSDLRSRVEGLETENQDLRDILSMMLEGSTESYQEALDSIRLNYPDLLPMQSTTGQAA